MPTPTTNLRAVDYTIQSLERRAYLAAGDLDLNFGTGGFLTGTGAPIEKLINSPGGFLALTRAGSRSLPDVGVAKFLPNGQPDFSFGSNGVATIGLATQQDDPIDFAVGNSGQIVVLASRFDPQTTDFAQYLARLNPDGSPDSSFNATGEIILSTSGDTGFASVTIDAAGAIYAGGGGPGSFVVRKFAPGGAVDGAFGTSGTLQITGTTGSQVEQLLIAGGNLFAVGADFSSSFIFARSASTGSTLGSFGSGGTATISGAGPVAEARLDSLGRIVVMAFESGGAAVTRFTPAGILDSSFGGGGSVSLGATQFETMDIGPDDNITVAGTAGNLLIVRRLLGTSGAVDSGYGTAGEALAPIPPFVELPGVSSVVIAFDGSTLVAGGDFEIQDTFYVARFLGDTPDFAVLDTQTGTLNITGTAQADQLSIDLQAGVTLVAQLGPDQLFFPAAVVTLINIDVGGGADNVSISPLINTPINALLGGGNNSYLSASAAPSTIVGGGGNDTIDAGPGNSFILGNGGSDLIRAGDGNDTVDTGSGGDFVDGGGGDDSLTGGDGPDTLLGGPGADTLFGRLGDDVLSGGDGNDFISGEAGNDQIIGGAGADTLQGDEGADTIDGELGPDTIFTGPGGGFASGGAGNDTIFGGGGNDSLDGGPGDDSLLGFGGNDSLFGGSENDFIDTGSGGDTADGGDGDDFIVGGDGADLLIGATGNDTFSGRAGNDTITGGTGNDSIDGEAGNDLLMGDAGNDFIAGGLGNDELSGAAGNDTLDAGAGNDRVFGGDGNDTLMGGDGSDTLDGQLGSDFVSGGAGNDLLISDDGTRDILNGDGGLDIARGDNDEDFTFVEYFYRFVR